MASAMPTPTAGNGRMVHSARGGVALQKLSIREFAKSGALSSLNTGVAEVMMLHACDKCIFSKSKWLAGMEMGRNAIMHLHPEREASHFADSISVVLENEAGTVAERIQNYSDMDPTLKDMERTLLRQTAVLSRLLSSYNMRAAIVQAGMPGFPHSPDEPIDWRLCSFTALRKTLIGIFAAQRAPKPFQGALLSPPAAPATPSAYALSVLASTPASKAKHAAAAQNARLALSPGSLSTTVVSPVLPESASPTETAREVQQADILTEQRLVDRFAQVSVHPASSRAAYIPETSMAMSGVSRSVGRVHAGSLAARSMSVPRSIQITGPNTGSAKPTDGSALDQNAGEAFTPLTHDATRMQGTPLSAHARHLSD